MFLLRNNLCVIIIVEGNTFAFKCLHSIQLNLCGQLSIGSHTTSLIIMLILYENHISIIKIIMFIIISSSVSSQKWCLLIKQQKLPITFHFSREFELTLWHLFILTFIDFELNYPNQLLKMFYIYIYNYGSCAGNMMLHINCATIRK